MSRIRSRNTSLETTFLTHLSKSLYPKGYRYRKHYKRLLGQPDIAFTKQKLAIFLDGDFWHGYDFLRGRKKLPPGYWQEKITRNIKRDKMVSRRLRAKGWRVLRFWEHDIRKNPAKALGKITRALIEET